MIIVGVIFAVLGWLLGIGILQTLGIILLVVGLCVMLVGYARPGVGGRRHWY